MTGHEFGSTVQPDRFKDFVLQTRKHEPSPDWQQLYRGFYSEEFFELLSQHGPAGLLLMPGADRDHLLVENPNLLDGVKEELGDLLWLDVSAAEMLNAHPLDLCIDSLKAHTGKKLQPQSFKEVQELVCDHPHEIKVLTKRGIYHPNLPKERRFVSLFDNPGYVLNRTSFRLMRALDQGQHDTMPLTASQMEPISDIRIAIGDHINVLSYISHLLGWNFEEVVRFNIDKLRARI